MYDATLTRCVGILVPAVPGPESPLGDLETDTIKSHFSRSPRKLMDTMRKTASSSSRGHRHSQPGLNDKGGRIGVEWEAHQGEL